MSSVLPGRASEHGERIVQGYTTKYWTGRLAYYERHNEAQAAAKRQRLMTHWRRAWKIELIEKSNPTWADRFPQLLQDQGSEW